MSHYLSRSITISMAHRLHNNTDDCSRIHGHNCKVTAAVVPLVSGPLVINLRTIKTALMETVHRRCDHNMLLKYDDPLLLMLLSADRDAFHKMVDSAIETQGYFDTDAVTPSPLGCGVRATLFREQPTIETLSSAFHAWVKQWLLVNDSQRYGSQYELASLSITETENNFVEYVA